MKAGVFAAALSIGLASLCSAATKIEKVLPFATDRQVRIRVAVDSEATFSVRVDASIEPAGGEGGPIWKGTLGTVQPKGGEVEHVVDGLTPALWSPATPALYRLIVNVKHQDGKTLDTASVRFGFRSVAARDGQILLNGKPIFLRGLAINPPRRDIPDEIAYSAEFARAYVKYLRSQNVNAIRLSTLFTANPRHQVWFDACDELGMMLYQGNYGAPPVSAAKKKAKNVDPEEQTEAFIGKDKKVPTNSKSAPPADFEDSIHNYQRVFETYARHPSIVIYTLTNEVPGPLYSNAKWHDYLVKAAARIKAWDPTRLILGNAGYGIGCEGDLNDIHRYWGWYYNSFLTYYHLRDSVKLFGQSTDPQPLTMTECVGAFTSPLGSFNAIFAKQLAPQLGWNGHAKDQASESLAYQSFIVKRALESFRTMRQQNHRLAGIMPFTIQFFHWRDIQSFAQMKPKPSMVQMGRSYQPVLLSWELWTPQVYAGTGIRAVAHVVNDADDFSDLPSTKLVVELTPKSGGAAVLSRTLDIPPVPYYSARSVAVALDLPAALDGDYVLSGRLLRDGQAISHNTTDLFAAPRAARPNLADLDATHIAVFDPDGGTIKALAALGLKPRAITRLAVAPKVAALIIGENAFREAQPLNALKSFVAQGGRVLCLGQARGRFDTSWLPAKVELLELGANDTSYPPTIRPTADQQNVNPQRPWHRVFDGVTRERLRLWSDYTKWDQSKPGFPRVFPVRYGFRLTEPDDLQFTAILGTYEHALDAVAVAEFIDGSGSVLLSALDLAPRIGLDPIADRMLANLVRHLVSSSAREVLPLVKSSIVWGQFASERGVLAGSVNGLVYNCRWVPPPTLAPGGKPLPDNGGEWASHPGEPFVLIGIRAIGPYSWSTGASTRERDKENPIGEGQFSCRVPAGRRTVLNKVQNTQTKPLDFTIGVNGTTSQPITVPPGKTVDIRTPIPSGATDLTIRFRAHKPLVILETAFE